MVYLPVAAAALTVPPPSPGEDGKNLYLFVTTSEFVGDKMFLSCSAQERNTFLICNKVYTWAGEECGRKSEMTAVVSDLLKRRFLIYPYPPLRGTVPWGRLRHTMIIYGIRQFRGSRLSYYD